MSIVEDLADALAIDALDAAEAQNDEKIIAEVSEILGASSQTAQEAFLTAIRVRRAARRAREFLNSRAAPPAKP